MGIRDSRVRSGRSCQKVSDGTHIAVRHLQTRHGLKISRGDVEMLRQCLLPRATPRSFRTFQMQRKAARARLPRLSFRERQFRNRIVADPLAAPACRLLQRKRRSEPRNSSGAGERSRYAHPPPAPLAFAAPADLRLSLW